MYFRVPCRGGAQPQAYLSFKSVAQAPSESGLGRRAHFEECTQKIIHI